jgi:hypothetical protein
VVVLTSGEAGMGVERCEVGCEHRSGDFSAVGAMADESVGKTRLLQWLREVSTGALASYQEYEMHSR